jgi:hypothetical protein
MTVLHEVEIGEGAVEPQTGGAVPHTIIKAWSILNHSLVNIQGRGNFGFGFKYKSDPERLRKCVNRHVWQLIANRPAAADFQGECFGSAEVGKFQPPNDAIVNSGTVSVLRRPEAKLIWLNTNYRQLNGDGGLSAQGGSVRSLSCEVDRISRLPKLSQARELGDPGLLFSSKKRPSVAPPRPIVATAKTPVNTISHNV